MRGRLLVTDPSQGRILCCFLSPPRRSLLAQACYVFPNPCTTATPALLFLSLQLQLTFNVDWLECPKDSPKYWGIFPCIGGDWVLAFVRLAPFVIIVLLDTSLFYQVGLNVYRNCTLSCAVP